MRRNHLNKLTCVHFILAYNVHMMQNVLVIWHFNNVFRQHWTEFGGQMNFPSCTMFVLSQNQCVNLYCGVHILSLLAMFGKVGRCIISLHHDRLILLDALSFKSRLLFHVDLSTLLRVVLKITVSDYNFLCSASSSSCSQLSVQHLKIHKFKTNCFVIIRKITKAI